MVGSGITTGLEPIGRRNLSLDAVGTQELPVFGEKALQMQTESSRLVTGARMVGERSRAGLDALAGDYLALALRVDRHVPGTVDAYFGPPELKAQVDAEPITPAAELATTASSLRRRAPKESSEPDRLRWLEAQLLALETLALVAAGEAFPYVEQVERCSGIRPVRRDRSVFAAAHQELARVLPGGREVRDRLKAWEDRFTIPPERLEEVTDAVVPRLKQIATTEFAAAPPEGESLAVSLVEDKPWAAYNWYDGELHSRIEINTDLPITAIGLVHTLVHETYPGHHLEHTLKEQRLLRELRRSESSVLLINTPESLISEGLAEVGWRYIRSGEGFVDLLGTVYEAARIAADRSDAQHAVVIEDIRGRMRPLTEAAWMLHVDEEPWSTVQEFLEEQGLLPSEEASKRREFLSDPLWRTYVFNYAGGEALLMQWCEAAGEGETRPRFRRLLTEQLTPSAIAEELESEAGPNGGRVARG